MSERDERNPRRGTSVDSSRARRRKDNGGKNQRANGALFTNSSGRMQRRKSDGTKAKGNTLFLRANGRRCFSNNAKEPPPRQMQRVIGGQRVEKVEKGEERNVGGLTV